MLVWLRARAARARVLKTSPRAVADRETRKRAARRNTDATETWTIWVSVNFSSDMRDRRRRVVMKRRVKWAINEWRNADGARRGASANVSARRCSCWYCSDWLTDWLTAATSDRTSVGLIYTRDQTFTCFRSPADVPTERHVNVFNVRHDLNMKCERTASLSDCVVTFVPAHLCSRRNLAYIYHLMQKCECLCTFCCLLVSSLSLCDKVAEIATVCHFAPHLNISNIEQNPLWCRRLCVDSVWLCVFISGIHL